MATHGEVPGLKGSRMSQQIEGSLFAPDTAEVSKFWIGVAIFLIGISSCVCAQARWVHIDSLDLPCTEEANKMDLLSCGSLLEVRRRSGQEDCLCFGNGIVQQWHWGCTLRSVFYVCN